MALLIFWIILFYLIMSLGILSYLSLKKICNTHIKRVKWIIYFEFRCYGDKSNWWRLYEIGQILRMGLFLQYFAISKIYKLHI